MMPTAFPHHAYDLSAGYRQYVRTLRLVRASSAAYCVLMLMLWALIGLASESWWVSHVLTYLPRVPYLIVPIALIGFAWRFHRKSMWFNLVSIGIVIGPIMDLRLTLASLQTPAKGLNVKVVSCNVQNHQPVFSKVLTEISSLNPEIVALQESTPHHELLRKYFQKWNSASHGRLWVGSKHPVRLIGHCTPDFSHRTCALAVEVQAPSGSYLVFNVHLMTARHALTELSIPNLLNGHAAEVIGNHTHNRGTESGNVRAFVFHHAQRLELPYIIVGDFNTPSSSSLYRDTWGDLTNAFDVAGMGYGYTSPCANHRFWLNNTPWLRIDHILVSPECGVRSCRIGESDGSDHRLISARVTIPVTERRPNGELTQKARLPGKLVGTPKPRFRY